MSLVLLPAEILHSICRFAVKIDLMNGVESFAKLALCCRFLNTFVSPYLYRRLHLAPRNIFLLVRSILEKPALALAIKEVSLTRSRSGSDDIDLGKAYTMLRKPGLMPKACTRHLHPGDGPAIVVLLLEFFLLQISQVEEISINVEILARETTLFDRRRWKPGAKNFPTNPHPCLKEFTVFLHMSFSEQRDIIAQTQNLISLSMPPRLYIETPQPFYYSGYSLTLPNVETLDIMCEGMYSWGLEDLLHSCPNVRCFQYYGGTGPGEWDDMAEDEIRLRDICDVLQSRRHVLESLELGFYHPDDAEVEHNDTIPDLRSFSRLKYLKLDAEALLDVSEGSIADAWDDELEVAFLDKFPRSLESLRIFRADERHLDELQSLARRKASDFPHMKTLTLEWWEGDTTKPLEDIDTDLAVAGIKLVLA